MTTNHDNRRQVQHDARQWAALTGTNYTTALRDVGSPLANGILGKRLTPNQLIQALDKHPSLGENGVNAKSPYRGADGLIRGNSALFLNVAKAAEVLRMFTPVAEPTISSYTLKHTAEKFLESYVTNGQLIWAATAVGLPMSGRGHDNPNMFIGVSELEHTYAVKVLLQKQQPTAHGYQPPGWTPLQKALDQFSATGEVGVVEEDLTPIRRESIDLRFHNWLISQAGRDDPVGDVAADYKWGTEQSEDPIARKPEDLLDIVEASGGYEPAVEAARAAIAEWLHAV